MVRQALVDVLGPTRACAMVVAVAGGLAPRSALAGPAEPHLPEPLLGESATDIDATDAGEVEVGANLTRVRAARGVASANYASLEVEWRVWKELGLWW